MPDSLRGATRYDRRVAQVVTSSGLKRDGDTLSGTRPRKQRDRAFLISFDALTLAAAVTYAPVTTGRRVLGGDVR